MTGIAEARRYVLTAAELDALWERLGLGPLPVALRLASPGRVDGERLELRSEGWIGLRDRGLVGPTGPDPEFVRLLRLLALPRRQIELRGRWDRPLRALAADVPGAAVVAVRQDATVALRPCGALSDALTALLPRSPPVRGAPPVPASPQGRARIVALAADGRGALRRLPGVLRILDGPEGRHLITPDGKVVRGDAPGLRDQITALLAA